jgi:hypothetical protein
MGPHSTRLHNSANNLIIIGDDYKEERMTTNPIPVRFVINDPEQFVQALKCREMPSEGDIIELNEGISFSVESATESRGFAVSELVVTGVITLAVGVSTELLSAWLKDMIWPHREQIKVIIQGKQLQDCDVDSIQERMSE